MKTRTSELETAPNQQLAAPAGLPTPSLLLDIGVLKRNIATFAEQAERSHVAVWPHAKTHRIPQVGALQIASGAAGLTVAKVGEAEAFLRHGVRDFIVAFPVVGAEALARAVRLNRHADSVAFGVDSATGALSLAEAFGRSGAVADVYLLIDSGLGRDGVSPEEAEALISRLASIPQIYVRGILTHEGSVYASADLNELERASRRIARVMVALGQRLEQVVGHTLEVSLGSTASSRFIVEEPGVTSARPGMYAFNDLGQVALGTATFADVAVRVVATVVSSPREGVACIDAGSKILGLDPLTASAFRDDLPPHGWIADLPGWSLTRLSEEHGWLRWRGTGSPSPLRIGQTVQVVPNHVCMTIFSAGEAIVVSKGREIDRWTTLPPTVSR